MMCADLVDVKWKDKAGKVQRSTAVLEDISVSGACLQFDAPLPLKAVVRITYPGGTLDGVIRYCVFREIGYFVGVEFSPESHWKRSEFRPQHMLDVRKLLERTLRRTSTHMPMAHSKPN